MLRDPLVLYKQSKSVRLLAWRRGPSIGTVLNRRRLVGVEMYQIVPILSGLPPMLATSAPGVQV